MAAQLDCDTTKDKKQASYRSIPPYNLLYLLSSSTCLPLLPAFTFYLPSTLLAFHSITENGGVRRLCLVVTNVVQSNRGRILVSVNPVYWVDLFGSFFTSIRYFFATNPPPPPESSLHTSLQRHTQTPRVTLLTRPSQCRGIRRRLQDRRESKRPPVVVMRTS